MVTMGREAEEKGARWSNSAKSQFCEMNGFGELTDSLNA